MVEYKNYMQENQRILEEWQAEFERCGGQASLFSWDGIMYQGAIERENGTEDSNWVRFESPNDEVENKKWAENPCRLLIMTKDQNLDGGGAWDSRIASFRKKNSDINDYQLTGGMFYKRLAFVIYGLAKAMEGELVSFEYVDSHREEVVQFIDTYPFAHVNCKKEGGGSSCPNESLSAAIEKFDSYLNQEVQLIDADVFLCCGSTSNGHYKDKGNYSLGFLIDHGYTFEYAGAQYQDIYCDKALHKIAIDAWHPSYFGNGVTDKVFYEECVDKFYAFAKDHEEFIKNRVDNLK